MLNGKNIIVIGASGGIGSVLVRTFVASGAKVTLSARTLEKLENVAATLPASQVLVCPADASDAESVQTVFLESMERFGRVDAVVISAGSWDRLGIDESISKAVELLDKHYSGLYLPSFVVGYVAQKFFRETEDGGLIVNISSHAAIRPELAGNLTYGPMKSASHHFMLSLKHELQGTKVRVTDLTPAIVNTPEAIALLDTEEKRAEAVQPEDLGKWIIENFDNPDIPATKLFDSTLIL